MRAGGAKQALAQPDSDLESDFSATSFHSEEFIESFNMAHSYLKDPLQAFFSNPNLAIGPQQIKAVYAARGLAAKQIDPLLSATGPFAEELRTIERERLASMKEKLFTPRRAQARKEIAELEADELRNEGTGLMWRNAMNVVADAAETNMSVAVEFTERDEEIFNHCIDVEPNFVDNDPFKGVQYTFFFAPNRFFSNKELRCSFHFASAYISVERIGVDMPFISAVTTDTPIQWKSGQGFENVAVEDLNPNEIKNQKALITAFFGEGLAEAVAEDIKKLICLWPRPLFTMLFETNTSAEAKTLLTSTLFNTTTNAGAVVFDDFPGGPATVKASSLEILPWIKLWRALDTVVRAPMISALDHEKDVLDDDYEDDEEEEEEGSDDSDESDDSDVKHDSKRHRAEKPGKAPAAPPKDCKQQ